jgi:hypothetical protein
MCWRSVCAASGLAKMLRAKLTVAPLSDPTWLNGCGLIVMNSPWTLADKLAILLPAQAKILGCGPRPTGRPDWLAGETSAARRRRPLSSRAQLVSSSFTGSDVPPRCWWGARGVTEAATMADAFPECGCPAEPPRREG